MIYGMMKQSSGIFIGVLITLAVIWFVPAANAFPAAAPPLVPSSGPRLETVAATPALHYQGRLLDPVNGQAKADGAYVFTFRIYNIATGGAPLWTETKSVSVNKGLFSTLLGDTTALDRAIFTGQDRYLGVTIGTDPEAAPRQRLAHVAYAMYAEEAGNASSLNGQSATAFATAGHTHDERYYIRQFDTQFVRTLGAGQSETIFTHSWPEAWYVQWSLRPTTIGGKIQWNGWIERGANGLLTYWFQVTNNGTITTEYAASYAVLQ